MTKLVFTHLSLERNVFKVKALFMKLMLFNYKVKYSCIDSVASSLMSRLKKTRGEKRRDVRRDESSEAQGEGANSLGGQRGLTGD